MIEIKSLYKSYGQRSILKNINLTIPKAKLICLIGPNGAGKSTLLSSIARLEKADRGDIFLDNEDIQGITLDKFSQKVSYLKQQNNIDLKLKVSELISFGRFPYSKGRLSIRDKEIVEDTTIRMDLESLRDVFIDQLSGGERQRVFLAMIMAQDTDYVLMDEPLNNLDMKYAIAIMKVAKWLVHDLQKTVIMVVHDINFAASYADYLIGMKAGEVVFMDQTSRIMQPQILSNLFEIDFRLIKDGDNLICNYYKI